MVSRSLTLALTAAVGVSSLQLPLGLPALEVPFSAAKKPTVDTKALQKDITAANLLKRAEKLSKIAELGRDEYNHPTRVIGSKGHLGTIDYIYQTVKDLGDYYDVSNQSFPAIVGNVFESRLVIGHDVPASAQPMGLTPPTKGRQPVFGDLVLVANSGCDEADYPKNLTKNIAFIKRGVCPFGTKSGLAGKAGAVAAIIYNNEKGTFGGTLGAPDKYHVASFGLSDQDAKKYLEELAAGKVVDSIAYIDAIVESIQTTNIIAQTKAGDPDNVICLGGHSDSVAEGPGINDDGSGTLSLLEVATQLAKYKVNNAVRFAWWAGEEEGLLGSDYYAGSLSPEENVKIRAFMDYDMMGSPNFAYQIYNATNAINPTGSEELRNLYVDWYEEQGLNYTFIPFDGRSDYDGFIRASIPAGGIATGAEGVKTKAEEEMFGGKAGEWYDPCYHQICDTVENVNLTAWEVNTKLIAHSVATYALSFEGFPEREKIKRAAVSEYAATTKYHGDKLIM